MCKGVVRVTSLFMWSSFTLLAEGKDVGLRQV